MARKKKGWCRHTWDWLLNMGIFRASLVLNLIGAMILAIAMWILSWYVHNR
jgi:hypothetical protein